MNLLMNERSQRSTWRDVFHTRATTAEQSSPFQTNGGTTSDRLFREWSAQRKWEDDGGRIAQDLNRLPG
jgi:hypothetical protein